MRTIRITIGVAAVVGLLSLPATAAATTTFSDGIAGVETAVPVCTAAICTAKFAGLATGQMPGAWSATIEHTPLSTSATITGGSFTLSTATGTFGGTITGGAVQLVAGSATGCTKQVFAVAVVLSDGSAQAYLTHYRTDLFGSCITYAATISGSVTLTG